MHDEQEMVRLLRARDAEGARRLVECFEGEILGLCLRILRHRQDAEDAAQESFVRAVRGISGFDASRPLLPWLLRIATNRCRTLLRRRNRSPRLVQELGDWEDPRGTRRCQRTFSRTAQSTRPAARGVSIGFRSLSRTRPVLRRNRQGGVEAGGHRQNLAPSGSLRACRHFGQEPNLQSRERPLAIGLIAGEVS